MVYDLSQVDVDIVFLLTFYVQISVKYNFIYVFQTWYDF